MPGREELKSLFRRCLLNGAATLVKVVVKGSSREDALAVQEAGAVVTPPGVGFVGLCLGKEGKLSHLLNRVLCPVAHKMLHYPGLPEVTAEEVMNTRRLFDLEGS